MRRSRDGVNWCFILSETTPGKMAVAACKAGNVGAVAWRASRQLNRLSRQHDLELGAQLVSNLVQGAGQEQRQRERPDHRKDLQVLSKMT